MKSKIGFILCCLFIIVIIAACRKEDKAMLEGENLKDTGKPSGPASEEESETAEAVVDAATKAEETEADDTAEKVERDYFIEESFTSAALASAKDGSSPTKQLKTYLPPSYYDSEKNYPVVYFFHGFGDTMSFIIARKHLFNQFMTEEGNKEFIVVEVDGTRANSSQGSFWVNSPVTGMWEDYVIKEIVPYIDKTYRTIPKAESRGTAGYSMGGFASLNLATRNPDVFSSVLSLCPGVLKEGSMNIAMDSWRGDNTFLTCYGQSFAPNETKENMCDIPAMDGTPEDNEIIEKWETGFGDWNEKLDAYLAKNQPLKAIHVISGSNDFYKWIPEGCADLSEIMTEKGIDHVLTSLGIGHTFPSGYEKEYFVPFFSENLVFEE